MPTMFQQGTAYGFRDLQALLKMGLSLRRANVLQMQGNLLQRMRSTAVGEGYLP